MDRKNKGISILNTILTILILVCIFFIGFSFIDFNKLVSKNETLETNEIEHGKTGVFNVAKKNDVALDNNEIGEFDNSVEIGTNNERNKAIDYYYNLKI